MSNPCTQQGFQMLKDKLQGLISKERPKVIEEIAEARSHGDLKENAEYHAAKEKQAMIEAQIAQLQTSLAEARVIDTKNIDSEKIQFGAIVEYENVATKEISEWQLVGKDEADFTQKKISIFSPIAKGLIGKREGDTVKIITPKGELQLHILSIEYK
jgi:transcription elongation factor GreA